MATDLLVDVVPTNPKLTAEENSQHWMTSVYGHLYNYSSDHSNKSSPWYLSSSGLRITLKEPIGAHYHGAHFTEGLWADYPNLI